MMQFLNQFVLLLFTFIVISRVGGVIEENESNDVTKCVTKCVNNMKELAQLKKDCKIITVTKCGLHIYSRKELKLDGKCYRVVNNQMSNKDECLRIIQNNSSRSIKSCWALVYYCISADGLKLVKEIRKIKAHLVIRRAANDMKPTNFKSLLRAEDPTIPIYICTVVGPVLFVIFVVAAVFKCCKKENSNRAQTYTVEVQPVSPNTVQNSLENVSPIYCEAADVFQYLSREHSSETTAETIVTDKEDEPPTYDEDISSEDETYCYPGYETLNRNNLPDTSEVYSTAYDYLNASCKTFPRDGHTCENQDDYEYPTNRTNSNLHEYRYAYDWRNPDFQSTSEPQLSYTSLDKDEMDNSFSDNYQALSCESLDKEDETIPVEYVTVL